MSKKLNRASISISCFILSQLLFAGETITCSSDYVRSQLTLNEIITRGTAVTYLEVKINQVNVSIGNYELCLVSDNRKKVTDPPILTLDCVDLVGNHDPLAGYPTNPTTINGPDWPTYSTTLFNKPNTDLSNDFGQIVLRQKTPSPNNPVVDFLCYTSGAKLACTAPNTYYDPDPDAACWASALIGTTGKDKMFLGKTPDGTGEFGVITEPTDGKTNDTPDNCPTCPATPPFSGRSPIVFKWQIFY